MPIVPSTLRGGTRDLPDVPPLAQYVIGGFLRPILAWVETALMRIVLARCADHPLVQIAQWYDPAPCRGRLCWLLSYRRYQGRAADLHARSARPR